MSSINSTLVLNYQHHHYLSIKFGECLVVQHINKIGSFFLHPILPSCGIQVEGLYVRTTTVILSRPIRLESPRLHIFPSIFLIFLEITFDIYVPNKIFHIRFIINFCFIMSIIIQILYELIIFVRC